VTPERTEIEWMYEPRDLFEAPYWHSEAEFELLVDGGRALAALNTPTASVPEGLEQRVKVTLDCIFLVRQLQLHRKYTLHGPRTYQHSDGRKNVSIRVGSAAVLVLGGQADVVVKDAAGNVVHDSRAERISRHKALLDSVTPKVGRSPALRSLLESYSRSVSDPDDELVHLYEIRDRLSAHYGGEQFARNALRITKNDWQRLGVLANVEPLAQGRHRGKHRGKQRTATEAELREVRDLVRSWILSFAGTI
jgi:hypothetical protein